MRHIQPAVLSLLACVVLGTLLWAAFYINDGTVGWFALTGPFLFVYMTLLVCCCVSCVPLFRNCYTARDVPADMRHARLRRATLATALSWLLLVLLTVFFVLLPMEIDSALMAPPPPPASWGAVFGVLLAAEIVLWLYLVATLLPAWPSLGQVPLLYFCCVRDNDDDSVAAAAAADDVPACFGGGDTGSYAWARDSVPRTAVQRAMLAYHVTLVVALLLAIVGTGLLLPYVSGPSTGVSLPAALSLFWLGLLAVLVANIVLVVVRMTQWSARLMGSDAESRQTKWLFVAMLVTLLIVIFSFQVLSAATISDAHLLFATLYAAFGVLFLGAIAIAIDEKLGGSSSGSGEGGDNVSSLVAGQATGMRIEWDAN